MKVISRMITEFNASQSDYKVVRQDFPQDAYNTSVQGFVGEILDPVPIVRET